MYILGLQLGYTGKVEYRLSDFQGLRYLLSALLQQQKCISASALEDLKLRRAQ